MFRVLIILISLAIVSVPTQSMEGDKICNIGSKTIESLIKADIDFNEWYRIEAQKTSISCEERFRHKDESKLPRQSIKMGYSKPPVQPMNLRHVKSGLEAALNKCKGSSFKILSESKAEFIAELHAPRCTKSSWGPVSGISRFILDGEYIFQITYNYEAQEVPSKLYTKYLDLVSDAKYIGSFGSVTNSTLHMKLSAFANQYEGHLPAMADADTRLDQVSAKGNEVRFSYTMIHDTIENVDLIGAKTALQNMTADQACSLPYLRPLINMGASIVFDYVDKNKKSIGTFKHSLDVCKK